MTVEEFSQELSQFGQELQDLSPILANIEASITNQIKSDAPEETGRLKGSIRTFVTNNTLEIEMVYYGAFQNYGVNGTEERTARKVQFGVSPRPTSEPFYAFKKRRFGLRAQDFFDIDQLQEFVGQQLLEQTNI